MRRCLIKPVRLLAHSPGTKTRYAALLGTGFGADWILRLVSQLLIFHAFIRGESRCKMLLCLPPRHLYLVCTIVRNLCLIIGETALQ